LSGVFLVSGINKIIYWQEAEQQYLTLFSEWQAYAVSSELLQAFFSFCVVWLPLLLVVATFIEVLGALLLLFGIKERLGAFLLILVLVPTTLLMQHFWFPEGAENTQQFSLFLRDLAVLGGLLLVLLNGAKGNPPVFREDPMIPMG
jgi:uncharacterized membrane protein YphA (DoxX/SURF4 family)